MAQAFGVWLAGQQTWNNGRTGVFPSEIVVPVGAYPGVLDNDTLDADKEYAAELVSAPAGATFFELEWDGSFEYEGPVSNTFTYRVREWGAYVGPASVEVTIQSSTPIDGSLIGVDGLFVGSASGQVAIVASVSQKTSNEALSASAANNISASLTLPQEPDSVIVYDIPQDTAGFTQEELNAIAGAVWGHSEATNLTGKMAIVHAIMHNKMVLDPVTGKLTVYQADGVTPYLIADIYEDVDGSQKYRNKGVNRREALS